MRMKLYIILCFCIFGLHADEKEIDKEFMSEQTLLLSSQNNEFALDLYRNLKDMNGNLCFSPYSISSALAMVYNGAKDSTKQEMADVLKFDMDLESLNEAFSSLNRFFGKTAPEVTADFRLSMANSLWIQRGLLVLPSFLDQMGRYFKVSLRRVDFLRQREIARLEINTFVKEKTFGKIKDLVQASDITPSTKMVLVSALYMKAKWKKPFQLGSTTTKSFFVNNEKTVSTPFMADTSFYPYFKSDDFTALEIPYLHPKENLPELGFLILLPKQNFGLSDLEKKLSNDFLRNVILKLESEEITLFLPKFNFSKTFNLKDTLTSMGMKAPFDSNADFSGITDSKDLQIGAVSHKVFIEVDENGTEAAAATSVVMNMKAVLRPKEPIIFTADHPFVFIIYEKLAGSILFCGRIINPLESF